MASFNCYLHILFQILVLARGCSALQDKAKIGVDSNGQLIISDGNSSLSLGDLLTQLQSLRSITADLSTRLAATSDSSYHYVLENIGGGFLLLSSQVIAVNTSSKYRLFAKVLQPAAAICHFSFGFYFYYDSAGQNIKKPEYRLRLENVSYVINAFSNSVLTIDKTMSSFSRSVWLVFYDGNGTVGRQPDAAVYADRDAALALNFTGKSTLNISGLTTTPAINASRLQFGRSSIVLGSDGPYLNSFLDGPTAMSEGNFLVTGEGNANERKFYYGTKSVKIGFLFNANAGVDGPCQTTWYDIGFEEVLTSGVTRPLLTHGASEFSSGL